MRVGSSDVSVCVCVCVCVFLSVCLGLCFFGSLCAFLCCSYVCSLAPINIFTEAPVSSIKEE